MSVPQRVLTGLAVAILFAAASVMVRSPTGLEKVDRSQELAGTLGQLPDDADWLDRSEDDLVARLVHDPLKLRGLRSFQPEGRIALKELSQSAEAVVRSTSRAARASGRLDPDQREAVRRALQEYADGLERLASLR